MMAEVLSSLGICCALGQNKQQVWQRALAGSREGMVWRHDLLQDGQGIVVGAVTADLPDPSCWPTHYQSRTNQLLAHAYAQIADDLAVVRARYGADRIAVVLGTSTSGIAEGELAVQHYRIHGSLPPQYDYKTQEMSSPAQFLSWLAQLKGLQYVISTACSSSARALMSAQTLLRAGLADAVLVGGVDSLCRLTLNGFHALESVSADFCQPFSRQRDGINIGEGAALFIMQQDNCGIYLAGAGATSDAHHMSAPEPGGRGAIAAITKACHLAGIAPKDLGYINLHGTATPLNDQMESHALAALSLLDTPVSSSKGMTGHTLGAAGAIEAALCWLTLSAYNTDQRLIPHCWDLQPDPALPALHFVQAGQRQEVRYCLSNSFAFGGNNVALLFGKKND